MNIYAPFTYYILHIPTNQHYYGVRFAQNCGPHELWTTYFTSSKHVHALISEYGANSFYVEVRRLFETASEARSWEYRVLKRMGAVVRKDWLNKAAGTSIEQTEEMRQAASQRLKATWQRDRDRMIIIRREWWTPERRAQQSLRKKALGNSGWTENRRNQQADRMRERNNTIRHYSKNVIADGVQYASSVECANAYGKSTKWVYNNLKRGRFHRLAE